MNIIVLILICVGILLLVWLIVSIRRNNSTPGLGMGSQQELVGSPQAMDRGELLGLLNRKQKIAAIKRYREMTGAGLREAKAAVELMEQELPGAALPGAVPVGGNGLGQLDDGQSAVFMAQIQELLLKHNKIAAIKLYREITGASLREAKDAVDQLDIRMHSGF